MGRTFLFTFDDPFRARIFVIRLTRRLDVAVYIDGAAVWVIGDEVGQQREEILRLAKGSRANQARLMPE